MKYLNIKYYILLCVMLMVGGSTFAQGRGSSDSDTPKKQYPPGSAWTLSYPLGSHIPSSIDTVLYNYQRQFVPALNSDAWATTGSFAAEGINMIFFDRPQRSQFLFEDALEYYLPTFKKEKFYNVFVPMTLLSYNFAGNQQNNTDRLKAVFAGNTGPRFGAGGDLDYLYTKGEYNSNAAKIFKFGLQGYYNGDRYEMQTFFNQYSQMNQENGGITDDRYITNPAELQGGVDQIEPKSIPTRLNGAQNELSGTEAYMSHAYKLGFWRDDSQPSDTIEKRTFIPVTKFIYSLYYKKNHRLFKNTVSKEESSFWKNTYFDSSATADVNDFWSLSNTFGVSMIEGFQRWAQFGLSVYATYEIENFNLGWQKQSEGTESMSQGLTPIPSNSDLSPSSRRNLLWVGGRLERMKGRTIRYAANAKFGLLGDAIGDIDIDGRLETNFRIGKDTVVLAADGYLRNTRPGYLLNHYVSNHFIWNNDFGKTRSFRAQGDLYIPWTRTNIRAGVENIQNQIYFNADALPTQYSGMIQIFSATIDQKLKAGIWNWDNTVTYQASSRQDIIPLPALAVYSNMYLGFKGFNVIDVQLGVDCDYYTRYTGLDYQPATMTFHVQGPDAVKVGNFAVANAYFTAKLQKTRFFVMYSHFNQGLLGSNYFSLPHYPIAPSQLRFGVSVDFAN